MDREGVYAVHYRAAARDRLLSEFDSARNSTAAEELNLRLAPHERERFLEKLDLDAGQAGVSNGRIARSGYANGDARAIEARKAKAADTAMMTALQSMLADPVYRALYDETFDVLEQYEQAAAVAMMEAELALDSAEEALALTRSQATRMEDGTRVYRGPDGGAITESGRILEGDELDSIIGLDDAPLYPTYQAQKKAVADAQATIDAIRVYQVETLGAARDHLEDDDNPVRTLDGLQDLQHNMRDAAPEAVSQVIEAEARTAEIARQPAAEMAVPAVLA